MKGIKGFIKGHPRYGGIKKGFKHSEETKRKISISAKQKGFGLWMKGKNGEKNNNWKGGKFISHGYIYIYNPQHPFATQQGYIREHRFVMEEHLGRYLKPEEEPHHINRIRNDNRSQNLMVFKNKSIHRLFEKGKFVNPKDIIFDGRINQ